MFVYILIGYILVDTIWTDKAAKRYEERIRVLEQQLKECEQKNYQMQLMKGEILIKKCPNTPVRIKK